MLALLVYFGFFFALVYGGGRLLGFGRPRKKETRYSPELVAMVSRANTTTNPYRHYWIDADLLSNGTTVVTCQNCTKLAVTEADLYTNCTYNKVPPITKEIIEGH